MQKNLPKRNLKLVMLESILTAGLLSMSIMTPFFNSIGLNQRQIALSQAIFTIVVSILNLPAGWIADRFSRKWANVIGDFGVAISFWIYAGVNSFTGVVICECSLGFFMAFSQGVDVSLLRHFSQKICPTDEYFRRQSVRLSFWQYVATLILVLLGGPIGAINFRLAILLSGLPSLVAGIISLFIQDDSCRLQPVQSNPLRDMMRILHSSFKGPTLRRRILAYAVGREMTHGIIWVFTPILIMAGVPLSIVSGAWALNSLACIVGTKLASKLVVKLKDWQILALPVGLMICSMTTLSIKINLWTVWTYLLMGVVQGWTGATLMTLVQEHTQPEEQTSVVSLAKVVGQIIYIPAVFLTGWAADYDLHYAPLMTMVLFVPISLRIIFALKRE